MHDFGSVYGNFRAERAQEWPLSLFSILATVFIYGSCINLLFSFSLSLFSLLFSLFSLFIFFSFFFSLRMSVISPFSQLSTLLQFLQRVTCMVNSPILNEHANEYETREERLARSLFLALFSLVFTILHSQSSQPNAKTICSNAFIFFFLSSERKII